MDYVRANDTCIQCHSQGRPLSNPIEGRYYDWPVGYQVGLQLSNFWKLEEHTLGATTFTHFPDGTAHKNRMQGNDFVQSVMYRRGVTCFDCHDVHGTKEYAQLRKPAESDLPRLSRSAIALRTANCDAGGTHPSQARQCRKRVRRLSHAEDRNNDCRCQSERPHFPLHFARNDGQICNSESLHIVPHGQIHSMGPRSYAPLAREIALEN